MDEIQMAEHIICEIERVVWLFHRQQDYEATQKLKDIISLLGEQTALICSVYSKVKGYNEEEAVLYYGLVLSEILEAQKNNDSILVSDLLEIHIKNELYQAIPIMYQEKETNHFWDKNIAVLEEYSSELALQIKEANPLKLTEYIKEPCNNGAFTVKLIEKDTSYYICSNISPQKAARELAEYYSKENAEKIYLWGLGLGYLPEAILEQSPFAKLHVIESDPYLAKLTLQNRDLTNLLSDERFSMTFQIQTEMLHEILEGGQELILYSPSIRHIQNPILKRILEEYYMKYISVKEQAAGLLDNFKHNVTAGFPNISVLKSEFEAKPIIYIGGGPSLDPILPYLEKMMQNYKIICAGTVVGKLKEMGIYPEYAIIIDPLPSMIEQIEGKVDSKKTSLLCLSSASKIAVDAFMGKKYIIYQNGFEPAESAAKRENALLFETGGSVSTTAIDIALRFGCSQLLLLGMDLGFTNGMSHSKGTADEHHIQIFADQRMVKAVQGEEIATSKNLDIYRNWIERRISREKQIEIVNVSNGAVIQGAKNISCQDFIHKLVQEA